MLARALKLSFAVEFALYVGFAFGLIRHGEWSPSHALLLAAGLALGWRALLIGATFYLSWVWRSPRPPEARIGVLAAVRMVLNEYAAFLALFVVSQPFERSLMGADRFEAAKPGVRPVILVHGWACNRGAWYWLRDRLVRGGYCVATLNLEPVLGSIDNYVDQIRHRVEEVLTATGARQAVLVAHSMGGLVCRRYLARHGAARVAGLVTLDTPHHGSMLAALGPGANAAQMRPGSQWLTRLNAVALPSACAVTVIHSVHDNFVAPQAGQILDGAENVALRGIGHLSLLFSREVGDLIANRLTR